MYFHSGSKRSKEKGPGSSVPSYTCMFKALVEPAGHTGGLYLVLVMERDKPQQTLQDSDTLDILSLLCPLSMIILVTGDVILTINLKEPIASWQ